MIVSDRNTILELTDKSGTLTRRKKSKIIRYVRYNVHIDPYNYFRELLMLYLPWTDETIDIESKNVEQTYIEKKTAIDAQRKKYSTMDYDLDQILEEIQAERNNQEAENPNDSSEDVDDNEFVNPYYGDESVRPNIMVDIGQESPVDAVKKFTCPDQLTNAEYNDLIISLNLKQRDYLLHVVNAFKLGGKIQSFNFF